MLQEGLVLGCVPALEETAVYILGCGGPAQSHLLLLAPGRRAMGMHKDEPKSAAQTRADPERGGRASGLVAERVLGAVEGAMSGGTGSSTTDRFIY